MVFESVNYQCPHCGGSLHYDGQKNRLVCEYCDTEFEVAQIEALFAEKEEQATRKAQAAEHRAQDAEKQAAAQHTTGQNSPTAHQQATSQNSAAAAPQGAGQSFTTVESQPNGWAGSEAEGQTDEQAFRNEYACSSCGAALLTDATTAVTKCPYCGNPVVLQSKLTGAFCPELVIPFKLDHEAAKAALARHYKGKLLLPKGFADANHIDEIQGVYVPFWLYDAQSEGSAHFNATRSRHYSRPDAEIIETDHFDAYREGHMEFRRVPVDASSRMPNGHMDAIEPFDYGEMLPYSTAYMPGFIANRWDEDADACRSRAKTRMDESTVAALERTVVGYESVTPQNSEVRIDWQHAHHAMLPVWMLSTTWNGKNFLFAMNGQTGRLVGDLPYSMPKLIISIVVAFVAALAGLALLFGPSELLEDASSLGICAICAAIFAAIIAFALRGQMKSAQVATQADAYLDDQSFTLTGKNDVFRTTTRQVIPRAKKD